MKTIMKFFAAGIIAGAASLYLPMPLMAAGTAPSYVVEKKVATGPEKFSISLSQVSNSGRINLLVEKGNNISLTVILRDTDGDIVTKFSINKKATEFSQDFDFSQAEEGIYHLEVSDGRQSIIKQIKYELPKTVVLTKFIIN